MEVPKEAFFYYNQKMEYGMHNGDFEIMVAVSSEDILDRFALKVREEKLL